MRGVVHEYFAFCVHLVCIHVALTCVVISFALGFIQVGVFT